MALNNPHDIFFKSVFEEVENAADQLAAILPAKLVARIALDKLKLDKNSYLDENLQEYYSDVVYRGVYKDQAERELRISFLFEHKSYPPAYPHLQLLRYKLGIWDAVLNERSAKVSGKKTTHPDLLPVVIAVIVYHGKEPWTVGSMTEYFLSEDEDLKHFIPEFSYILFDLSCYTNEELKERVVKGSFLKVALLLLKNIFDPQALAASLEKILEIGKMYYKEEKGTLFLVKVLRYLFAVFEEKKEHELLKETVKKAIEKQGVEYMTILESIETKALEKGKKEGVLEGIIFDKQQVLIMQLTKKFGLTKAETTFVKSVKDKDRLDQALNEIVTATSKEVVLSRLH